MIRLEASPDSKRKWDVYSEEEHLTTLDLESTSITNKFEIVKDLISKFNDAVPGFSEWYNNLVLDYIDNNYNAEILINNKEKFLEYSIAYVDNYDIDFSKFVNRKKSSKSSILFDEKEIRAINIASCGLKLYSIFYNDKNMKPSENLHKIIYEEIIKICYEEKITDKIYELVRSKTYRSSITDRYMWGILGVLINETPDSFSMNIFNSLMINFIPLINIDVNPIVFLVSIIDDGIKWLMKNSFREKIIYGESYGTSGDAYGNSLNKESFHYYACKDTLIKVSKAAIDYLYEDGYMTVDNILSIYSRLENSKDIPITHKIFNLPVISYILDIPYKILAVASPKHIMLISILLYRLGHLKDKYPILSSYLISVPEDSDKVSIWSTYKIKNIERIINNDIHIFGFQSPSFKYSLLSPICGILSSNRKGLIDVLTGEYLNKQQFYEIEKEAIDFYSKLYGHKHTELFDTIKQHVLDII